MSSWICEPSNHFTFCSTSGKILEHFPFIQKIPIPYARLNVSGEGKGSNGIHSHNDNCGWEILEIIIIVIIKRSLSKPGRLVSQCLTAPFSEVLFFCPCLMVSDQCSSLAVFSLNPSVYSTFAVLSLNLLGIPSPSSFLDFLLSSFALGGVWFRSQFS